MQAIPAFKSIHQLPGCLQAPPHQQCLLSHYGKGILQEAGLVLYRRRRRHCYIQNRMFGFGYGESRRSKVEVLQQLGCVVAAARPITCLDTPGVVAGVAGDGAVYPNVTSVYSPLLPPTLVALMSTRLW